MSYISVKILVYKGTPAINSPLNIKLQEKGCRWCKIIVMMPSEDDGLLPWRPSAFALDRDHKATGTVIYAGHDYTSGFLFSFGYRGTHHFPSEVPHEL